MTLLVLASFAGCFVSIDESKLDPQDAAEDSLTSDAANDQINGACNHVVDDVTFAGQATSETEIDLRFTSGPAYELDRGLQGDIRNGIPANFFVSFPPCTSSFVDQSYGDAGDGSANVGVNDAGLHVNFDFTYILKPLLDDGGLDPRFTPLTITVRTYTTDDERADDWEAGTSEMANP